MNRISLIADPCLPDLGKTGIFRRSFRHNTYAFYLPNFSWISLETPIGYWIPGMDQAYYNTDPKIILDLWKENGQKKIPDSEKI